MKKTGLGRGVGALIRDVASADNFSNNIMQESPAPLLDPSAQQPDLNGILSVDIRKVEPNPTQPRQFFDETALAELAESIKVFGIIQPLLVTEHNGHYTIIAGERRYRAARLAKLSEVPVIVKDYTDMEILQVALLENIQRQDLTPIEEANCYKRLIDDFFFTADDIANKLGKNKHAVINTLHLLELPPLVQGYAAEGRITASHAKILLGVQDPHLQESCAEKIVLEGLSVRGAEAMVQAALKAAEKKADDEQNEDAEHTSTQESTAIAYRQAEHEMKQILGSQVHIRPGKKKSKIEIEYYTTEDLDRILGVFKKMTPPPERTAQ